MLISRGCCDRRCSPSRIGRNSGFKVWASTTAGIVVILRAAMEDRAMAAQDEAVDWAGGLDALVDRIAPRFCRVEPRRRVRAYLRGLLAPVERKNGWQLAENAGDRTPDGVQDFLARMRWDADQVRD